MNAMLVRVAADQSSGGGSWNGPADGSSNDFAYVAIPEPNLTHPGLAKPYSALAPALARFGVVLPSHLSLGHMHLDPDFEHLTYGDSGQKAKQIWAFLQRGDRIVFYAGLRDVLGSAQLLYGIIGIFEVDELVLAAAVPPHQRDFNAHSRRVLPLGCADVIVRAKMGTSGRLKNCMPIGEYRDRAYRVRRDVLDEWGGLSVKDGYLQRSARIPSFLQPERFLAWFEKQNPTLVAANN